MESVLIGDSLFISDLKKTIGEFSKLPFPVLIEGETGTGKDSVARIIHYESNKKGKFCAINCGAMTESLLEGDLFGYGKGAFTGAVNSYEGLLYASDNGTLFLNEIECMSPRMQSALLDLLETGCYRRLGSNEVIRIKPRIIASTNQSLSHMVRSKLFRKDLYFRLNVLNISIPPLRERKEDIFPIAAYYIKCLSEGLGLGKRELSSDSIKTMEEHHWPGNVRELINCIKRIVATTKTEIITAEDMSISIDNIDLSTDICPDSLTITELAKVLGISRKTLWLKKKQLG